MSKPRLLVVDDKLNFHALFRRIVGDEMDLLCAADGLEALRVLARESVDVIVCDVKMPGLDGLGLLKQVKVLYPDVEVILMTAFAAVPDAVEALRAGAHHYLTKPFDPDDAMDAIRQALARRRKNAAPRAAGRRRIVAASDAMRSVVERIVEAAATSATVLITGESGTGKELVAAEVHARSSRAGAPFVVVKCGALSESAIEAEALSGAKGAAAEVPATWRALFHQASGGTVFLDDVADLPAPHQVKLLRAVQGAGGDIDEQTVDVRVIAATNVDVAQAIAGGRLREDLYYRLDVVSIRVPPLRERREDITPLAREFLDAACVGRQEVLVFSEEAAAALNGYSWPGNVRQLENAVARAAAATRGAEVERAALPEEIADDALPDEIDLATLSYREVLALSRDRVTREYFIAVLKAVKGNVTQAAERAGIERESLHRLLKRHALRADDYRGK